LAASYDERRLARFARRIEELRLWRNALEAPVEDWRFRAGEGGEGRKLCLGDFWPEVDALPVHLTAEARVPEAWRGLPVELELWLGGEGFVRLSNGVTGGLNPFHRTFRVAESASGVETVGIEAEVVSRGMFGSAVAEPRLTHARLVVPEVGVRALERDLSVIAESCEQLGDHETVPLLLDALEEAFAVLSPQWPTASDVTVTRHLQVYENPLGASFMGVPPFAADKVLDANRIGWELWQRPLPPRPLEPLPEGARRAVEEARRLVARRLAEVKERYPPVGRLALTGHAHIDLAWLWPLAETRRKARRTFASVLSLMERYEDFVFNQSSAQLYEWVEGEAPDLFERVKERVAQGRWEPVGGSWTEPDCQVPGGEAFVRQLLYGQRYFEERFGRRSTVAWLPDAFGFSPGIPQLLKGAGLTGFFTHKMKWSEANRFPHDLFLWEGVDGSRVLAHFFENPGADYNGDVAPFDLLGTWRNAGPATKRHGESLFSFGWGDGGGGPSERMLENYARLREFPALPRLRMSRVDDFFASLPREGLPAWVGELYLELHRGTLTSQGRTKKLNREAEHRLLEAEAFAAISALDGTEYPKGEMERLWKTLLLNQFHDILPGSSIHEVYEEAREQLEGVVQGARSLRDEALTAVAGVPGNTPAAVTVANAGLSARPLSVLLPPGSVPEGQVVADATGEALPVQQTGEGTLVHDLERRVPGLGWTTLRILEGVSRGPEVTSGVRAEAVGAGAVLENDCLRVEVGVDGALGRVFDGEMGREVLSGPGNALWAYADKPREWDAWDVDEDYALEGVELPPAESVEVVEGGPLRGAVRVVRRWRDSEVVQTYRLHAGSRRLEIWTEIDWRERPVLLRALFPLNVHARHAAFETMYGAHERPTHRNTSPDAARFEVSAHRWVDLSEPGYGVALLNDGRYGHSAEGNVLGLSLVRSPLYPDPTADLGRHRFTYALYPHPGRWTEAGVVEEAFALNSPLVAVPGGVGGDFGLVVAEGLPLALGGLKVAEDGDGVILRLHEPRGGRGEATLRFGRPVEGLERVNLLEEPEGGPFGIEGGVVRLSVRPFEVVSLRVRFG
jgi:alpha-mannosidase